MIVKFGGWTGIYVNSKLVHKISPHELSHRAEITLAETIAAAVDEDIAIAHAEQVWTAGQDVLPYDLSQMKLRIG